MNSPLEQYSGRRVLVTGGAGFMGRNLAGALSRVAAVTIVDDLSSGVDDLSSGASLESKGAPGVEFVNGSIGDDAVLGRLFENRYDVVFHLAALFANQNSVDHPEEDLAVNGLGTLKLLGAAARHVAGRVVYTSSSCVYGNLPPPAREDRISLEPDTPYAATKLLGELYCRFFQKHYSLPTVIVRCFNVYGPGDYPGMYRSVIPNFIYRAMSKQPLSITGSGEESRDFTYVDDITEGLLLAGTVPEAAGDVFNLGAGKETRVIDLAAMVNRLCGSPAGGSLVPRRDWDDISRRRASIARAKRVLGYRPKVGLEQGLAATVQWFRADWDRISGRRTGAG